MWKQIIRPETLMSIVSNQRTTKIETLTLTNKNLFTPEINNFFYNIYETQSCLKTKHSRVSTESPYQNLRQIGQEVPDFCLEIKSNRQANRD